MIGLEQRRGITARELARMIGVSQSAVSRAFTPGASISPAMRERVLAAADSLGYRPNAIASILSRQRSDIVGVVVSDMQNPFNPALIEKVSRALQANGQQTLLFNITPGNDVRQQLAALRQYSVDAIIVISAPTLSGAALAFATEGRSAIVLNRAVLDSDITSVSCDNVAGGRAIADHFHALGLRRVAYVAGLSNTSTNFERRQGFTERLAELGMVLTRGIDAGIYSYQAGYGAALEIARTTRTEGIFFFSDILAAGGMDALRDVMGLAVPDDISVAGFDDIAMAGWPRYGLTTLRQPVDAMVALTVGLLANMAGADRTGVTLNRLAGELVVRTSTGAPLSASAKTR